MAWPSESIPINRAVYFVVVVLTPFLIGIYELSVGLVVALVAGFHLLHRIMVPRETRFLIGFVILFIPAGITYLIGWGIGLLLS